MEQFMEEKQRKAEARKKALKEMLEGVGMLLIGAVAWLLSKDFTFVEGVTTRSEGRTQAYLIAAAAAMLIIGSVLLVLGLVHLIRPPKNGGNSKPEP